MTQTETISANEISIEVIRDCVEQMEQCEKMFQDDAEFMHALNNARSLLEERANQNTSQAQHTPEVFEPDEVVKLFAKASIIETGDADLLTSLTPAGVRVLLQSHDTATHLYVYLKLPDEEPLLVWYMTNWLSNAYLFNECGKVHGYQTDCDFARPLIDSFIRDVADAVKNQEEKQALKKKEEIDARKAEKTRRVDAYKDAFLTESVAKAKGGAS